VFMNEKSILLYTLGRYSGLGAQQVLCKKFYSLSVIQTDNRKKEVSS